MTEQSEETPGRNEPVPAVSGFSKWIVRLSRITIAGTIFATCLFAASLPFLETLRLDPTDQDIVQSYEDLTLLAMAVSILFLVPWGFATIALMAWTHRTHCILEDHAIKTKHSPRRVLYCWVIPVWNFYKPWIIIKDMARLVRVSPESGKKPAPLFIGPWWFLGLFSALLDYAGSDALEKIRDYHSATVGVSLLITSNILFIVTVILLIRIVRRIQHDLSVTCSGETAAA